MRVHVYAADDGGCGRYRLRWPAQALADADVHDRYDQPDFGDAVIEEKGERGIPRVVAGGTVPDCDVVVIQRPLRSERLALIDLCQRNGVAVVVDIDDDFSALDPRNVSWKSCHPGHSPSVNWHWLKRACAAADLVTVSTPALAERYGRHGRVAVLRNCIPASYMTATKRDHDGLYVGWSGSVDTHPGDLEQTRGAVGEMQRKHPEVEVAIVGTGKGVSSALALERPLVASGWVEIEDYPRAVAQLDVGIVPLVDSAFNRAKSWLKGLEMAALGVPFVASPLPEYARLAKLGAGALASSRKDWVRELDLLIRSRVRREEAIARGRCIASTHTVEGNAERWLVAWHKAAELYTGRRRRAA